MKSEFCFPSIKYLLKIINSIHAVVSLVLGLFIFIISIQRNYQFETDLNIKSFLLSLLFSLLLLGFLFYMSNYTTIENGYLNQYNPFLLRKRSIPLSQIANLQTNLISTGRGLHKGIIVDLKNGEQLKWISQINKKKELVELEKVFIKLKSFST